MHHHLVYRAIVGDYESIELPFLAQNIVDKPFVGCSWYAVDNVERGHERTGSSLGSSLVRSKILIIHAYVAHVHGVVVAS